ncbi:hypothetical protein BDC45DRAFT_247474 [Circinella umbellata]|nr:hypothetical protein BDC45DRAFT_247474 [Circinella umbellata]
MVDVSRTWKPQTHWKIGTINITEKFQQFRSRSIFLSDAKQNLSDNRVLSLSNIFVITPYQATSCLHRLEPNAYKAIVKNIKRKEFWPDLPFPVRTWCGMIDQMISRNDSLPVRKLYALVRNFGDASDTAFEEDDYDDEDQETEEREDDDNNAHVNNEEIDDFLLTTNILYNLIGTFRNWMSDCFFELTFIAQHVFSFIQPIFQRISVHVRLGETHINGKPDSLLADCVGSYQATTGDKFDVLACEVKPCKTTSISQVQFDFVKLGKEMKEMLDALLDYGVKSPLVTGVLIEGKNMTTYTIRLTEQSCYILYEHEMFSLLESPQDVHRVPVILEHLIQLANLLKDTTRKISECSLSNEPSQAEVNWKQPSAGTPLRTNEER